MTDEIHAKEDQAEQTQGVHLEETQTAQSQIEELTEHTKELEASTAQVCIYIYHIHIYAYICYIYTPKF